uniref:Myosin heavy chain-related family protein n=1 Tax=Rhizophora mucronata TaxID=61149 RepID=A0A2P2IRI3_RHIMU
MKMNMRGIRCQATTQKMENMTIVPAV